MGTQVFSAVELERLRGFPEIDREELVRFFTLTPADAAFVSSEIVCANLRLFRGLTHDNLSLS